MKHAHEHPLAFQVGRQLGFRAKSQLSHDLPDLLIPVPMYWYRRFRRGINSASLLADGASTVLERPVAARTLWCCRATSKQSMLSVRERLQNVRHSFRFWWPRALSKRHVAIVDDTMTTGATAHELARLLTSAGVRRVTVLVAARAIAEWKQVGRGRSSPPPSDSKLPQSAQ
jgi:ComF family protein